MKTEFEQNLCYKSFKDELRNNKNSNGGGLATNLTGRFESNRHAIARQEKFTFGEVVAELKKIKNGGFRISANELLEIYTALFGTPEWHHAGKLPKQYGGGMKKTYFLNDIPTIEKMKSWLAQYEEIKKSRKEEAESEEQKRKKRIAFIKKFATKFNRLEETPKFSVITEQEMNGKHGWFEAKPYRYSLPIYYSGWEFKSKKSFEKYNKLE